MIKRNDLIFAAAVVIVAVLILFGYNWGVKKEGIYVRVMVDGKVYGEYPLNEERRVQIEYEGQDWENELVIDGKKASVVSADCPDGLCIRQKAISKTGESIICLPHKLVITITGGGEAEYDGIAG